MNIWDKITGSDMTKEMKTFAKRAKMLPTDYQVAWEEINTNLWSYSDFSGRNLMPILDGVLEVTGSDVAAFCDGLITDSKTYADIYQEPVNQEVNKAMKKHTDKIEDNRKVTGKSAKSQIETNDNK